MLDIRAELARIDQDRAETQKLFDEARKLRAEEGKLLREGEQLRADWRIAPWVFAVGVTGAIIGGLLARHL